MLLQGVLLGAGALILSHLDPNGAARRIMGKRSMQWRCIVVIGLCLDSASRLARLLDAEGLKLDLVGKIGLLDSSGGKFTNLLTSVQMVRIVQYSTTKFLMNKIFTISTTEV